MQRQLNEEYEDRTFAAPRSKILLLLYLMLTFIGGISMLVLLWPNQGGAGRLNLTQETAFLIAVAVSGFIGSTIHVLTSFTIYITGARFPMSAVSWYISKGYIGAAFAVLMYLAIRGLVVSTDIELRYINTYGILAICFVSGLFADVFLIKLKASVNALLGNDEKIETQLDRIDRKLGTSILDNYKGFVCTRIDRLQESLGEGNNAGYLYELVVWFDSQSVAQKDPSVFESHALEISDGNDTEFVDFKITPKSETIKFTPSFASSRVTIHTPSAKQAFRFVALNRDTNSDNWLEINQKNRLVAAFSITLPLDHNTNYNKS